jgi:N-acetylneuraminic acid mutarotase
MNADSMTPNWFLTKRGAPAGQQTGPLTWQQLHYYAQTGAIAPDDLVWNPQLASWLPAFQVPGLFPAAPANSQEPPFVQPFASQNTRSRNWLAWVIPLIALLLAGGGLGAFFGLRGGGDDASTTVAARTTTTMRTTTTVGETVATTTTTEAAPTTTETTTPAPAAWIALAPGGSLPAPRDGHVLACDPKSGKTILFGGTNDVVEFGDTWAYDPAANSWSDLAPAGPVPAGRDDANVVYVPTTGKMILFGGYDGTSFLNDTWAYDPLANTWTDLHPAGAVPSAREDLQMVYDSAGGKMILFGGYDEAAYFNDTWAYDPVANTWTELHPAGTVPSPRDGHSMSYDPVGGKVILFGGWDGNNDHNDTWAYDPVANAWTELSPAGEVPGERDDHSMVYDSAAGTMILFGGYGGNAGRNDTWAYDSATNAWTELHPAGASPPARVDQRMAYDSAANRVILVGGYGESDFLNDAWAFGS